MSKTKKTRASRATVQIEKVLTSKPLSAEQLADKADVSKLTIYRALARYRRNKKVILTPLKREEGKRGKPANGYSLPAS